MFVALTCLGVTWMGAAATSEAPAGVEVEMKPVAIVLDAPPQAETQRSCVLRRKGGGKMRIVSAAASDPAIRVTGARTPRPAPGLSRPRYRRVRPDADCETAIAETATSAPSAYSAVSNPGLSIYRRGREGTQRDAKAHPDLSTYRRGRGGTQSNGNAHPARAAQRSAALQSSSLSVVKGVSSAESAQPADHGNPHPALSLGKGEGVLTPSPHPSPLKGEGRL